MRRDAVAAWLIPSEFMETKYGAVVRQYLTQRVGLIRIHRFSPANVQFENALVSSAVIVFRNHPPLPTQTAIISSGGTLLSPEHTETIAISDMANESKWAVPWIRRQMSKSPPRRIGDLFDVRRGLATGANAFFILERNLAAKHGIPEIALRPVLPKARTLVTDIIEREEDGYPHVAPQLCLLDCDLPQETLKTTYPRLAAYLETAPPDVLNATLVRSRSPWYRQEQRKPAPFLCTYMGRSGRNGRPLRFLWNKSDAVATNTYLMLYPREALATLIKEKSDTLEKLFDFLKDIDSQDLLNGGRVYGGGLHKIEPKELLNVRLYSLPSWLEPVTNESKLLL